MPALSRKSGRLHEGAELAYERDVFRVSCGLFVLLDLEEDDVGDVPHDAHGSARPRRRTRQSATCRRRSAVD